MSAELLQRAWRLADLDPPAARSAALQALDASPPDSLEAAWAHWHLALADVRTAAPASARRHGERARELFARHGLPRGLALCAEVEAIGARHGGDKLRCRAIHDAIDHGEDPAYEDSDRFLAHHSRALTAQLLGETDRALAHFYEALSSAEASGCEGARITALDDLGRYHHELFNLEDARSLSERALKAACDAGARPMVTRAAANLILVHHAAGQPRAALSIVQFLTQTPEAQLHGALQHIALPIALAYFINDDRERAQAWLSADGDGAPTDGTRATFWTWLSARLLLARGEAHAARELAERTLASAGAAVGLPCDQMELQRALADACEAVGDLAGALAHSRRADAIYRTLVGLGTRARERARQAAHAFARVERELAAAQQWRVEAETDRRRLVDLNRALEAKVAETELLHAQLREQVLRDPLTGLYNRRYLFEVGPGLVELARRHQQASSVALIDLDHFKQLNDCFGHGAGDAVLQRFAGLLQAHLRRSDVLCRYGGEEFVVVMPDVPIDAAVQTMVRVLEAWRVERVEYRQRLLPPCTFSAGVAVFPTHGDRLEHLLGRADKALYRAKEFGRARVEHATHTGFATLT